MQIHQTYNNPLDSFTDREQILAFFEHLLRTAQSGQFQLLTIKGNSGTGKTFLISYLINRICPNLSWQSGYLPFSQSKPDFLSILMGIEDALRDCVPYESLQRYRVKRDEYHRHFDEYKATITIHQSIEAGSYSVVSHINQNIEVSTQLREREQHLQVELSRALIELSEERERPLCLFIDGYERLAEAVPEVIGWFWEDIIPGLAKASSHPLLVVTCGWEWPSNATIKPFSYGTELTDFDLAQVRSYLIKQEVFVNSIELSAREQEELVAAFYALTEGHPLVLSLAVTYFNALEIHERVAKSLQANRILVNERAALEFLQERLLSRLPEPYRTLLERGPILRYLEQGALQALLGLESQDVATGMKALDDRSYRRFLQYPFVNRMSRWNENPSVYQPTFHNLVRRVQLEALRYYHPLTKEHLHRKMADYYLRVAYIAQEQEKARLENSAEADASGKHTDDVSKRKYNAFLEYIYHSLQVEELRENGFAIWSALAEPAMQNWLPQQAEALSRIMRQLAEEGEFFLNSSNDYHGRYLLTYSCFLIQEARFEEAQVVLEKAVDMFEQLGNNALLAYSLHNIAYLYGKRGNLEEALRYYERSLVLTEQEGHRGISPATLSGIGSIYLQKGNLEEASRYYERSLTRSEQVNDAIDIAISLTGIGSIAEKQGKLEKALEYYERALVLSDQESDVAAIVGVLNKIGLVSYAQGNLEQALSDFEQALTFRELIADPAVIAQSLNYMGVIYYAQGILDKALSSFEQALVLREQVDNSSDIAQSLHNMGEVYHAQEELEQALEYHKRALALREKVGSLTEIIESLSTIGIIYKKRGELEQTLGCYEQTLALQEQAGNITEIVQSIDDIVEVLRSQGNWAEILPYCEQYLAIFEHTGEHADIARASNNIGFVYGQLGNWKEALAWFDKALSIYQFLGHDFELDIADQLTALAMCYAQLHDSNRASDYLAQADQIRAGIPKNAL